MSVAGGTTSRPQYSLCKTRPRQASAASNAARRALTCALKDRTLAGGKLDEGKGAPVGVAFQLRDQLINSVPLEGFHAAFTQPNGRESPEVTATL